MSSFAPNWVGTVTVQEDNGLFWADKVTINWTVTHAGSGKSWSDSLCATTKKMANGNYQLSKAKTLAHSSTEKDEYEALLTYTVKGSNLWFGFSLAGTHSTTSTTCSPADATVHLNVAPVVRFSSTGSVVSDCLVTHPLTPEWLGHLAIGKHETISGTSNDEIDVSWSVFHLLTGEFWADSMSASTVTSLPGVHRRPGPIDRCILAGKGVTMRSTRIRGLTLVAAALVNGAFAWLVVSASPFDRTTRKEELRAAAAIGNDEDGNARVAAAPAPDPPVPFPADAAADEPAANAADGDVTAGRHSAVNLVRISGTLVVIDGGELRDGLRGTLVLEYEPPRTGWAAQRETVEVDVVEGKWHARMPRGSRFRGQSAMLEEREVRFESGAIHDAAAGPPVELIGAFTDLLVHVIDAETRAELEGVSIVRVKPSVARGASWIGPYLRPRLDGTEERLRDDAVSPLRLARSEIDSSSGAGGSTFVHAPGFGWLSFAPPRGGAECIVELHRAAALRVRVEDVPPVHPFRLRLRCVPGSGPGAPRRAMMANRPSVLAWEQELTQRSRAFVLDDLAPLTLIASIEAGRPDHARRLVLAEAEATLVSGRTTEIELRCAPPPDLPAPVPLAGRLEVPVGWFDDDRSPHVRLRFEMVDRPFDLPIVRAQPSRRSRIAFTPG